LLPSRPALDAEEVTLDPSLLVASCERLKKALLDELGLPDQWQGRINIMIEPSLPRDGGPQLTAIRQNSEWYYQLNVARNMPKDILLGSLTQAILLEIANRQDGVQSPQVPPWLVEGMLAHLQANSLQTFLIQPGQQVSASFVWHQPSSSLPSALSGSQPLSFQRLSWPEPSDFTPEGLPLYRACAQLFLEALLRLDDGRACLRAMITHLPEHWNWQTAFLLAFHSHFNQLLDVEKWWSVNYIMSTADGHAQLASAADCRRNLQSSLDVPVQVHFTAGHMPVQAKITLQEAFRQWPVADAAAAAQNAIVGLKLLEPRATPQWRTLVQRYLKTLAEYLDAYRAALREPQLGKHATSRLAEVTEKAVKQLDALDRQRETMATPTLPEPGRESADARKPILGP